MVIMEERMKGALMFLKLGKSFNVGGLKLSAEKKEVFEVTGWSNYNIFNNLTKTESLKEVGEVKELFKKMIEHFPDLKKIIKNKDINYNLVFDDSGKGSIGICSEKKGVLFWEIDLK
jgi:hypothetical protein